MARACPWAWASPPCASMASPWAARRRKAGLSSDPKLSIRELMLADVASYRDIRLEGLRLAPDAFGSSYEEEVSRSDEEFARRITGRPGVIVGAFDPGAAGAARLVGTAGCYCDNTVK